MPLSLRRPTAAALEQLLVDLAGEPVTYAEHGATRDAVLLAGYHSGRHAVGLGEGAETFGRGRDALRTWQAHRHAGALLTPSQPDLIVGTDVVTTLRLGFMYVMAPCRIIYVTDDDTRFGFGYGTLPGHPESGEESFHVRLDDDGLVRFELAFFARMVDPLARLGTPVARTVQRHVTRRYLDGVRRYVEGG